MMPFGQRDDIPFHHPNGRGRGNEERTNPQ
jgi:hypothetical protein